MTDAVLFASNSIEWGTPHDLIERLPPMLLDVCATPGREKAPAYFGPEWDSIGWYTDAKTKRPLLDEAFRYNALRHAQTKPPAAIDGLKQDWRSWLWHLNAGKPGGLGWLNPPFGRGIASWVERAALTGAAGSGCAMVMLVPARTDTAWWHDWIEPVRRGKAPGDVEFLRGRQVFEPGPGYGDKKVTSAPFPTALVTFEGF